MVVMESEVSGLWQSFFKEHSFEEIRKLLLYWPDRRSLLVSYADLQTYNPEFAQYVVMNPQSSISTGQKDLRKYCRSMGEKEITVFLRLQDLPGDQQRPINKIRSEDIGKLLGVDAVVSRISGVRPRLFEAAFQCTCGAIWKEMQPNEQQLIEPMWCSNHGDDHGCGGKRPNIRFTLVPHQSQMINTQFIELQQPPEQVKGGGQPDRISCIADHDLAGQLTPGDRVVANGELFVRTKKKGGKETPVFDIFLQLLSIERQNIPLEEVQISEEEEQEIKDLASRADIVDLLENSIAPSIFGYSYIKRSLVLQLFGGVSRKNSDGTRLRGDIHILLLGDPGVAKSQMLHFMSQISPRGRFTSGMSASSAGLTAAAVQDSTSDGRWTLEAGALPLADQGLAAIDEFDKMGDGDRSSMHEAMEQQTISISKAGINASLSTRCAVLAAANPKGGNRFRTDFDEYPFNTQVNIGAALLTRFDVIWLITDTATGSEDERIAGHIMNTRAAGVSETLIEEGAEADPAVTSSRLETDKSADGREIIGRDLFRKFIAYTKRNIHPVLDKNARARIQEYYVETRRKKGASHDSVAISPRSLEALARLSEASAKIRLSQVATREDAEAAISITEQWRNEVMGDNYDETTMHTGMTPTKRDLRGKIMQVIMEYQNENGGRQMPLTELYSIMDQGNYDRSEVERLMEKLSLDGHVFHQSGDKVGVS